MEIHVKELDETLCRVSFMPDFYMNLFPILKFLRIIVFRSHLVPVGPYFFLSVNTKKCSG